MKGPSCGAKRIYAKASYDRVSPLSSNSGGNDLMRKNIASCSLVLLFAALPIGLARAAIVANFTDGEGTASVDQFTGTAGNGWLGAWSLGTGASGSGTTRVATVTNANPLNGGDNYLSVTMTTGTNANDNYTAARRQFGAFDGVDPTMPHTISFDFRPEAKNEIPNAEFRSRFQMFGSSLLPGGDTSASTTWWVVAAAGTTGSAPHGVVANNWGFLTNPNPAVTPAPSGMNFVDSGIAMNVNTVYHFEIAVDPVNKSYVASVSDGSSTFTSETLYFRNQDVAAQSASYLAFGARQQNTDNEGLATYPFSFDSVSIVPTPTTAGDFDGDGDVDGADFVAWQTNFPKLTDATPGQGDADGDGDVDGADFSAWQQAFPGSGSGVAPVPEPSPLILATLGVAGLFAYRCSRR